MKFKSEIDYKSLKEETPERIELKGERYEIKGVIEKMPLCLDYFLTKYVYRVIMFVEDINIAKELFNEKNTDIEIDGKRYYRSEVEQKPRAFMEAPEYEWEFTYYSYDLFD